MQSSIVAKLMSVLTSISESQTPLTFSELVKLSGLNKSTIHRLLAIGIEERLVQFDKNRKVYLLGPKVFDLVRHAYKGYDIQAVALDQMIRLHGLFDANIAVGVPNGMEVVYLRVIQPQNASGTIRLPGMRDPVHCSASGKALLAFMPEQIVTAQLEGYAFERFTPRTITNAQDFRKELDKVRRDGFASNDREEFDNILGISTPLFNYLSEPIAVLNIWTVSSRHTHADILEWSGELMDAAAHVTGLIGGVLPDA